MAWITIIDPNVNCVFTRFYDAFEVNQIMGAAVDMFNHPEYQPGMNFMRDFREQKIPTDITYKAITSESVRMMDKFDDKHLPCKSALVAGDVQSYSKIHQYIVTGRLSKSPVERKAFRDIEKAKEWLGLPQGYVIKYPEPGETT